MATCYDNLLSEEDLDSIHNKNDVDDDADESNPDNEEKKKL